MTFAFNTVLLALIVVANDVKWYDVRPSLNIKVGCMIFAQQNGMKKYFLKRYTHLSIDKIPLYRAVKVNMAAQIIIPIYCLLQLIQYIFIIQKMRILCYCLQLNCRFVLWFLMLCSNVSNIGPSLAVLKPSLAEERFQFQIRSFFSSDTRQSRVLQ